MSSETTYFADPQLDRAASLIFEVASQVHVTRNRVHALEQLLVRKGVLAEGELDGFEPTEAEQAVLDAVRDAGMEGIMRILTEDGPAAHPLREEAVRAASL